MEHTYEEIVRRWPKWFDMDGDISHTLMPFGFPGPGWADLIWRLCEDIEKLVPPDFEVLQVKEKFGGLRFYASGDGPDGVDKRISEAEKESYKICENCGAPGRPRDGSWIKTYCDACEERQ